MTGPPENFASLLRARRGYLAAGGPEGVPPILPVCFTWAGDVIWAAADRRPAEAGPAQRVVEILPNQRVSFLVDRWDEDWTRLAWLQARGRGRQTPPGTEADRVIGALRGKYAQYEDTPLDGPIIRIDVDRWLTWEA